MSERRDPMPAILNASTNADWGQVVANGGPPCFHVEYGKFCLRAERWDGHHDGFHQFVSLRELLEVIYAAE